MVLLNELDYTLTNYDMICMLIPFLAYKLAREGEQNTRRKTKENTLI